MRLIGSKTEQDFRDEFIKSHNSLFNEHCNDRLLNVLRTNFPNMKTAYFIGITPDQGEDLYTMLIDTNTISFIELDRYNLLIEPIVEFISIDDYRQGLSKCQQIKLLVALDLAQEDLKLR